MTSNHKQTHVHRGSREIPESRLARDQLSPYDLASSCHSTTSKAVFENQLKEVINDPAGDAGI
jgi:hypothetical protein